MQAHGERLSEPHRRKASGFLNSLLRPLGSRQPGRLRVYGSEKINSLQAGASGWALNE